MNIPHNWRGFYLHTFSSLLWNHLASYRVREYGLKPVEGDLVLKKVDDPLRLIQAKYVHQYPSLSLSQPLNDYCSKVVAVAQIMYVHVTQYALHRDRVHVLTQQDLHTGQYGLADVVLPLLGTNLVLPSNSVADK